MTAADTARIRSAFREAALGLMEWEDPPVPELHEEVAALLAFYAIVRQDEKPPRRIHRPFDKQGETEPFNVDRDWEERS